MKTASPLSLDKSKARSRMALPLAIAFLRAAVRHLAPDLFAIVAGDEEDKI